MVMVRDGHYRAHIEEWVAALEASYARKSAARHLEDVQLEIRIIGHSATLGALENAAGDRCEAGQWPSLPVRHRADLPKQPSF